MNNQNTIIKRVSLIIFILSIKLSICADTQDWTEQYSDVLHNSKYGLIIEDQKINTINTINVTGISKSKTLIANDDKFTYSLLSLVAKEWDNYTIPSSSCNIHSLNVLWLMSQDESIYDTETHYVIKS